MEPGAVGAKPVQSRRAGLPLARGPLPARREAAVPAIPKAVAAQVERRRDAAGQGAPRQAPTRVPGLHLAES